MTAAPSAGRAPRVAFIASDAEAAQRALAELRQLYGTVEAEQADVIVPLGGDGFMLETLHRLSPPENRSSACTAAASGF